MHILLGILGGLMLGSFLAVVVIRYPAMLQQHAQHHKLKTFNLIRPRSHCMHCKVPIRFWHNIPLIGFILLRGRCNVCKQTISSCYWQIEIITSCLTAIVVWHFHLSWQLVGALLLMSVVIVLTYIDIQHRIIPDLITLTTLWCGLLFSLNTLFITPAQAICGAALGYSLLWLLGYAYQLWRNQSGMGYGDYKMLAMLGAWLGPSNMIVCLFIASITALIVNFTLLALRLRHWYQPTPFAPYLAIAGITTLLTHFSHL